MKPVEIELTINAPLARIYAMAVDIENTPKVFPQIVRVEMLNAPRDAAGLAEVGTRWKETRKAGGREATVELAITQRVVNESFRVTGDAMKTTFDTDFRFTRLGDQQTRVRLTMTATPHGLLAKMMAGMMGGMVAKALREDLDALKRAAEAGPTDE